MNTPPGEPHDDRRLEAWLREPGAELPDRGFSQQVLRALPPPRRRGAHLSRLLLCGGAALGGGALAAERIFTTGGLSPARVNLEGALAHFNQQWVDAAATLAPGALATGVGVTAATLVAIWHYTRPRVI